ncbi:uncharacterized protein EI90DRAFT_3021904 [Cantharellus anzutake]|uniref:uncharacterized protein n=1 Tax=Cantharellus anzutake TaxID=1750568 RepID=UPI00190383BB|nr:uncharacterized protein EI90DRAFT_3021904 [Cantharellus anzutake]KAF8315513.1 hypothetical protein EI90DRAFT_3021904 [Cantharellus anzutake]
MYTDSVANQIDREKHLVAHKGFNSGLLQMGCTYLTLPLRTVKPRADGFWMEGHGQLQMEKGLGDAVDGQVTHVSHQWSEQVQGAVRGSQLEMRHSGDGKAQRLGGITDMLM